MTGLSSQYYRPNVYPGQALAGEKPWLDQSIAGATQTHHRQSASVIDSSFIATKNPLKRRLPATGSLSRISTTSPS